MNAIDLSQMNTMGKNTLGEALGIEFVEVSQERLVATMPVDHRTRQPAGLLHGGASVALAETIASVGSWLRVAKEGKMTVGLEINANHLRRVTSGKVKGVGSPLHVGKTSQVWEVKIYNEEEKLVCVSRCTLAVIEPHGLS